MVGTFVGGQGQGVRELGLKGEKGERRTGVEANRDVWVRTNVRSRREGYGGSCTLSKARLSGRLDAFEGGLKKPNGFWRSKRGQRINSARAVSRHLSSTVCKLGPLPVFAGPAKRITMATQAPKRINL